jgi:MoaA/NifB/PqqE/SkfB family radical SAM enzyme
LPGSHELLMKGIKNIVKLEETKGITYRSNTVVCGLNYDKVEETAALLYSLRFKTTNFILFNPIVEADSSDKDLNVEYSKAGKYLSRLIDIYGDKINKITVRYMPFCQMTGYERFITNMPQIQYDPDEWDYLIRTRIREGRLISFGALIAGIALLPKSGRLFRESWNTTKHEGIKRFLEFKNKVKGKICTECALEYICGGVWKQYAKWKGFGELKPQAGEKIFEPAYFMTSDRNL